MCPGYALVSGRAGHQPFIPWLQGLLLPGSVETEGHSLSDRVSSDWPSKPFLQNALINWFEFLTNNLLLRTTCLINEKFYLF